MPEPYGSATRRQPLFSRQQVGGMFSIIDVPNHPGSIWWVDSTTGTDASGYGYNPDSPVATIDYAVGLCTANKGDVIYVMPNHTETIASAGALTLDVQGIKVIGLGIGDDRPVLNWTATDATVAVDDCDILVKNLMFTQGIDAVVVMWDVNSDDFTMEDCEFVEAAAAQAVSMIDVDGGGANACDNLHLYRVKAVQRAAGGDQFVDLAQVQDGVEIVDCYVDMDAANACVYSPAILTDVLVQGNVLHNRQAGDHALEFSAAAVGHIVDNRLFGDTAGTILDPGSCFMAGNIESAAIDQPGTTSPLVLVDSAINAIGADNANNAFASTNVVDNADGSVLERQQYLQERVEICVVKTDGAVLAVADPLFTITGGPILVTGFFGLVTTIIGGAANCQIQIVTTTPAGTVNLSTDVAIDNDAAGTSYHMTAATPGVFTPTTAGAFDQVPTNNWFCPIGTIQADTDAAQTGVIAWYMTYKPLSPDSVVAAAA